MSINQICQIQGREYRNFASPLSNAGVVELPYSREYYNPGYNPGKPGKVHGYDIGGTLAGAKGRDEAIRRILGLPADADVKKVLFENPEMTKKISEAQEKGILDGEITMNSLEGVVEQLGEENERGEDSVLITVGTYQMARSFIHGAGLEKYVSALVTSEEAETGNKKTVDMFVRTYERLQKKGKNMETYCDDSENDAKAAVNASRIIAGKYGEGMRVYLIKKDAKEEELGEHSDGYIVVRNIREKEEYEKRYAKRENKEKGEERREERGDQSECDDEQNEESGGDSSEE